MKGSDYYTRIQRMHAQVNCTRKNKNASPPTKNTFNVKLCISLHAFFLKDKSACKTKNCFNIVLKTVNSHKHVVKYLAASNLHISQRAPGHRLMSVSDLLNFIVESELSSEDRDDPRLCIQRGASKRIYQR